MICLKSPFTHKKKFAILLAMILTLMSVAGCGQTQTDWRLYSYDFLGAFDTVIRFLGFAQSEKDFNHMIQLGQDRFEALHKQFDIYNNYEGVQNLKMINDQAGIAPVPVSQDILDLLTFAQTYQTQIPTPVSIALGPVLVQWHDARAASLDNPLNAYLPDMDEMRAALPLANMSDVVVDVTQKTVFLKKKGMRLDVGAIAKGYACEVVAQFLKERGYDAFIISAGGNVRTVGQPKDGRNRWGVGIQNPNGNAQNESDSPLDVYYTKDMSVVTSGDYQRTYLVGETEYHHLIDPKTLMPATYYRSVTVATEHSGAADYLSTAAFLLPFEESYALISSLPGTEALWLFADGHMEATDGMKSNLKTLGGAVN